MFGLFKKIFGTSQERTIGQFKKIVSEVNQFDEQYKALSDDELRAKTDEFKKRHQAGESLDQLLPEAYGVIKNACRRLCGTEIHVSGYDQKWDMIPYDVQIVGAIAMHHGNISEMQTGEGKTLTATMPLYLNALSGGSVHLVTVNDYLATRDCEWVGTILRWLGLTTGTLTNGTPPHKRREIYQANVVYGTASEFGFDYLRDNSMAQSSKEQAQRSHTFAVIDEIDSILIDEARTPLIISGPAPQSTQMYDQLQSKAASLVKKQRDCCNKIASEAKRVLERYWSQEEIDMKDKQVRNEVRDTCLRLWLVSLGMPNNKILRRAKEHPDLRAEVEKWSTYFHGDQTKAEKAEKIAELYLVIDEKSSEFELTDRGIAAWGALEGCSADDFIMLDLGHEYAKVDENSDLSQEQKLEQKMALNDADALRKERSHNLRQLLHAHLLMELDIDYIVVDGKIVIIDEHTGRPQPGRRFSDGLHQAIEAKENVEIQKETQTYATITLQNYFRMYDKIAGMTGTAITEAGEFKEIYQLDVLQIPTYKVCKRDDANDEIYMTEREKYHAILQEIREIHEKGRPILIGTESVEVSEKLARILKQNQIKHTVLNAKYHEQEAEIIAQAGAHAAVTVSTNMAGRGTDIKLKSDVAELGGLHVIGTTRHQSRRIDRQLRGRSARLGDPGSTKFFVSFEDQLLRLFASPRLTALIQRFRPPEGEPISAGILNRSIETAQKRVENRNYTIRKHTLEYDDVMNKQRLEIYDFRNDILHNPDLQTQAIRLLQDVCSLTAQEYFVSRSQEGGWDPEGYRLALMGYFPINFQPGCFDNDHITLEEIEQEAGKMVQEAFMQKIASLITVAKEQDPELQEQRLKQEAIGGVMLHKIDELWKEHLHMMDHLRTEVSLRTVAQKDPLLEFKEEAFELFFDLSKRVKLEIARNLFKLSIRAHSSSMFEQILNQVSLETNRLIFDDTQGLDAPSQPAPQRRPEPPAQKVQAPVTAAPKVGRNDLCPCKSGQKYKKCCGAEQ